MRSASARPPGRAAKRANRQRRQDQNGWYSNFTAVKIVTTGGGGGKRDPPQIGAIGRWLARITLPRSYDRCENGVAEAKLAKCIAASTVSCRGNARGAGAVINRCEPTSSGAQINAVARIVCKNDLRDRIPCLFVKQLTWRSQSVCQARFTIEP